MEKLRYFNLRKIFYRKTKITLTCNLFRKPFYIYHFYLKIKKLPDKINFHQKGNQLCNLGLIYPLTIILNLKEHRNKLQNTFPVLFVVFHEMLIRLFYFIVRWFYFTIEYNQMKRKYI